MLRAIIFDLDNTLVNFWQFKLESAKEASVAMVNSGLEMTPEACEKLIFKIYETHGVEYQMTFSELLKPFKLDKAKFEKIRNSGITAYLRKKVQVLRPYDGVIPMLTELRGKYKLAVLTDAPREQAKQRLKFAGLEEYFDAVSTFHDTNIFKPGSEPFLHICKKLQVEPNECLMVGDNAARDIVGAKKVGMITCLAEYDTYFKHDEVKADFYIKKPIELLDAVKKIE